MIDTLLHGGLSALYLAIMMYSADTMRHVGNARVPLIRKYARAFLLMTCFLTGTFAVIQGVWVAASGFDYWPEPLDWLWMIFDATNALAYIAFIGATRVFLLWAPAPCLDAPDNCPRRHLPHA